MAEVYSRLLALLTSAVGDAYVLVDPADVESYITDWRGRYRGRALAVVRPGTTAEVAAVITACAEAGVPVVPQGGNTGQCGAATPDASGDQIVLNLGRMNRIRALDTDNATLTVEAGVVLTAVQQAADAAGLLFPLSLAAEGSCQIGGNLATNAGGTAVLRFGNARDLALGVEVVLPDGRIWDGLRGLRKDNTGYDLKQLFIGSEGTLGVITAAVLKLFPKPRSSATALAAVPDIGGAIGVLRALRQTLGDRLTGAELVSAYCLQLVHRHQPTLANPLPGYPWYVLLQADDSAGDSPLSSQLELALAGLLEAGSAKHAVIAQSEGQAATLWSLRESVAEAQRREGPNIKHDISLPVSHIPRFLTTAEAALNAEYPGLQFIVFGHLGDGNLHYNLAAPVDADPTRFLLEQPRINRIVHDLVTQLNGSISAEHGIGQLKRDELAHYKSPLELQLMRAIKQAIDPRGLMNPGKVL